MRHLQMLSSIGSVFCFKTASWLGDQDGAYVLISNGFYFFFVLVVARMGTL